MVLKPIEPQPGSDRDPANFVGRHEVSTRARQRLQVGANLLLTDPRRMGKTFWMHAFAAQEKRFHCYFIDYEGVFTVNDFLIRTADALIQGGKLPSRAFQKLKTIFDNCDIEISSPITIKSYHRQTSPHVLLTDILSTLDGEENDIIPLVMMDEVPMAVNNIAEREGVGAAEEILQTLRALRQKTTRVRWIVTGSIGFHHVLSKANMTQGVLNDLESLPLGPLTHDEADELARRLLLGVGHEPSDEVSRALVDVSGGSHSSYISSWERSRTAAMPHLRPAMSAYASKISLTTQTNSVGSSTISLASHRITVSEHASRIRFCKRLCLRRMSGSPSIL